MFFRIILILVACLAPTQSINIGPRASIPTSNTNTSLTLIYQNNLNVSDDQNHVGAVILDPISQSSASSACATINEKLLPRSTLQDHSSDFIAALSYQDYAGYFNSNDGFFFENGTVSVDARERLSISGSSSHRQLPVLCTQTANNGSYSAVPADGSKIAVTSRGNTYIGYRNQKSFRFLGIPYANRPRRWSYSSAFSKTNQTIAATSYGSQCLQSGSGSEDCLFLNVQTPYIPRTGSKTNLRPVLFWIHGGGFTGGSGADPLSDGGNLASREDIVTVTINYRLSTLGFLAIPETNITGNYGIADQITALEWTIENIASFGGDPNRITIMGESAGAGSVRALLGSPKAIGKFHGAVAMSNLGGGVALDLDGDYGTTYSSYYTVNQSFTVAGQQVLSLAGCNSSILPAQIACLKQIDAASIVQLSTVARYVVQDGVYINTPTLPLTSRSTSTANIPVIFGVTRDDGASFSTYPKSIHNHSQGLQLALGINTEWAQRIIDSNLFPLPMTGNVSLDSFNVSARIVTDKTFRCVDQSTVYSGVQSGAFRKAFFYQMDRTINGYDPNHLGGPQDNDPNEPYFRLHGADMPWVFGTLNTIRAPEDLHSVQLAVAYFSAFVKNGDPNPPEGYLKARGYDKVLEGVRESGEWNEIDGEEGPIRLIDFPSQQTGFVDVSQCEWLGYALDYYLKGGE